MASRRLIGRWRQNPDPLNGKPLKFPPAEKRVVRLDDGADIAVHFAGSGPTVVLVHGLTASHHDWAVIAPGLLDAGYRVVAVDQRGHGESTEGSAGYGSRQLGRDLAEVFDALDLHATALVGHSMGGMAIMGFAVEDPPTFSSRVESVVLIATAAATSSLRQGLGLRVGGLDLPDIVNRLPKQRLRIVAGLGVFGSSPNLHTIDEVLTSFKKCSERVRTAATAALRQHDLVDELSTLDQPALVIGGGKDQLISQTQIDQLDDVLVNSTLHMYPSAGHMLILPYGVDIAERIVSFATALHPEHRCEWS